MTDGLLLFQYVFFLVFFSDCYVYDFKKKTILINRNRVGPMILMLILEEMLTF